MNGADIVRSMATMHDRSNGLGGGFAGYGIYPQYKDYYAFHVFYEDNEAKKTCEAFLERHFEIINLSKIPVRKTLAITDAPLIWRYFVQPLPTKLADSQLDEKEFVVKCVIRINVTIDGAYVFSSGKNMGVFKAVGFPEDEISSYDANRRYIEMFGYQCTLLTDTEVITYIIDYLLRKKGLTLGEMAEIIAAPFWSTIETKQKAEKKRLTYLRNLYSSLLITGPFSILLGFEGGMMALNDRLKLRSMVVGEKDDRVYIASEECAIRVVEPNVDRVWAPRGGEPVIVTLEGGNR